MNDTTFSAQLKAAKLTARKDPDSPDTIIRRVQFTLARDFSPADAEWIGAEAVHMRKLLQQRDLHRFEVEIDGYHAKASFHGLGGNADVAQLDGMTAVAGLVGSDEDEHEEINFTFEAFPEAKLLTFLAMAMKGQIDCELKALQLDLVVTAKNAEKPAAPPEPRQRTIAGVAATAPGRRNKRARKR